MNRTLWLLSVILCGLHLGYAITDPDLWWHITVGRWIIAHHRLPQVDLWNMFSSGEVWRAYSWSVEVVLALCDRWWGEWGLFALQVVLGLLLSMSFSLVLSRLAQDYFIGLFFGSIALVACQQNFTLRPQVLAWILMALCVLVADTIALKGISRGRLLLCVALGCAWANIHLTAALGLWTIFLWSMSEFGTKASARRASIAALAFLVGTFVTPYFGGEWITFLLKSGHPIHYRTIAEFAPATIQNPGLTICGILGIMLLVVTYVERRVPPLGQVALSVSFLLASGVAVKFIPFAVISVSAQCATWWRASCGRRRDVSKHNIGEGLLRLRHFFCSAGRITHGVLGLTLACLIVAKTMQLWHGSPIDLQVIPKDAVDFIVEKNLGAPVLNEFGTGGYLMYRRSDPHTGELSTKVTIDGRTNVNPPEIWELYVASTAGKHNWNDYIERVHPKTILWRRDEPLAALLRLSPDWCEVFTSGTEVRGYVVFVSRELFDARRSELSAPDCA